MARKIAEVLVVSDIHAMSPDVEVARLRQLVAQHPAKRLVLAGDTLDLYMWRHSRRKIEAAPGLEVLRYLLELVAGGVKLTIIPGNHDEDWAWLVAGAKVAKRKLARRFPAGLRELMVKLVAQEGVEVVSQFEIGNTMIVHGHEGWQGDWLWRVSDVGDKLTQHRMVGGNLRRQVMGKAPVKLRSAAVRGHGFYRRLAAWGRKMGMRHVIHGHTHCEGRRVRKEMVLDCLPAWRPSEGQGGGMLLRDGVWERVEA